MLASRCEPEGKTTLLFIPGTLGARCASCFAYYGWIPYLFAFVNPSSIFGGFHSPTDAVMEAEVSRDAKVPQMK